MGHHHPCFAAPGQNTPTLDFGITTMNVSVLLAYVLIEYKYVHSLIIHSMLTVLLPYFHQATKDGRTLPSLVMCTKIKRRASMTIQVHMPTQVSAFCSFVNRFTKSFVSSSLTSWCMQICILAGRTDVEGCCWWGRGVIQTSGVW